MLNKKQKLIISSFVSIIFTSFLLLLLIIVHFNNLAFGWFSANKNVNGSGLGVTTHVADAIIQISTGTLNDDGEWEYTDYIDYNPSTPIDLSLSIPGSMMRIKVKVQSKNGSKITVSGIGINAFTDNEEVGLVKNENNNNNYYYLGTQILVYEIDENDVAQDSNYLATYITDTNLLYDATNIQVSNETYEISGSEYCEYLMEFKFENKDEDQSVYANFGNSSGNECCKRRIYVYVQ